MLEVFRAHALHERHFLADGLELAEGFVVVEQLDVHRGKGSLGQHLGEFLALQGAGADDGDAVETVLRARSAGLVSAVHGAVVASNGGGGGLPRRRKMYIRRAITPESM